jgi:hypothetical protein
MSLPFAPAPVRTRGPFGAESGHKEGTKFGANEGQGEGQNGGPVCRRQRMPQPARVAPYRPAWLFGTTPPGNGPRGATGGASAAGGEGGSGRLPAGGGVAGPGPVAAGWTRADLLGLIVELEAVLTELRLRAAGQ